MSALLTRKSSPDRLSPSRRLFASEKTQKWQKLLARSTSFDSASVSEKWAVERGGITYTVTSSLISIYLSHQLITSDSNTAPYIFHGMCTLAFTFHSLEHSAKSLCAVKWGDYGSVSLIYRLENIHVNKISARKRVSCSAFASAVSESMALDSSTIYMKTGFLWKRLDLQKSWKKNFTTTTNLDGKEKLELLGSSSSVYKRSEK